MAGPSTPCINICVVEPSTGLCVGCGRNIDEIGRWGALSEGQRLAVMAGLPDRLRALVARPDRSRGEIGDAPRRTLPSSRRRR